MTYDFTFVLIFTDKFHTMKIIIGTLACTNTLRRLLIAFDEVPSNKSE